MGEVVLGAPGVRHPSQTLPSLTSVLDTTPTGLCTLPSSLEWCFSCLSAPPLGPQHFPKGWWVASFPLSLVSLRADKERVGSGDEDRTLETPIEGKHS